MSENLGSVYYTVDANTTSMLEAEALINKSISGVVKDFSVADKAVSAFVKKQEELGRTVNKAGQVFNANGKIVVSASNDYRALASAANMAKDKAMQMNAGMSKTAQGVSAGMRGMQGAAQNFSYQIQDIAVQLAGGQNPFLIIAQQLPQMLVGMGAAAAGIGALVAVVGGLAMAVSKSGDKVKTLDEITESLNSTFVRTSMGTLALSNEIIKLAKVSELAVQQKLAQSMLDASDAASKAKKEIFGAVTGTAWYQNTDEGIQELISAFRGLNEETGRVYTQFNVGSGAQKRLDDSAQRLGKSLGFSGDQATKMGREVANLIGYSQSGKVSFKEFVDQLSELSIKNPSKQLTELSTKLIDIALKGHDAQEATRLINEQLKTLKSGIDSLNTENITSMVESLNQQLSIQKKELTDGKTAAALLSAAFALGLTNAEQLPPEIKKLVVELNKLEGNKGIKEITDDLADQRAQLTKTADGYEEYALRKKLAADDASEAVIQANLKELRSQRELKRELDIMNQVDADTQTQKLKVQTDYEQTGKQITADLETPAQKAERELAERLEVIRTYNALETAEDAKKTEMGMLALDAYAAKIQEINAKTKESNFASTLSDSFVGLQNQISGTMAQVAIGIKDGDDAAKALATTIATELVGAMINYGIKQAWAYTFGAAASTAAAATQATAAVAATTAATTVSVASAAAIAAAWATPAALVSAATFGASAVAGTAALTAAVAASGAMALASQSLNAGIGAAGAIAGGKLYGGSVQSGTMYPVNENGAPELFQSGNKQYLMPNSRGEVISNKDATSGGSSGGETMVNFTYSPNIQALDSDGVATILAEQQETLWNLVQRAANERGRKL